MIRFDVTPAEGELLLEGLERLWAERTMEERPRQRARETGLEALSKRLQDALRRAMGPGPYLERDAFLAYGEEHDRAAAARRAEISKKMKGENGKW